MIKPELWNRELRQGAWDKGDYNVRQKGNNNARLPQARVLPSVSNEVDAWNKPTEEDQKRDEIGN